MKSLARQLIESCEKIYEEDAQTHDSAPQEPVSDEGGAQKELDPQTKADLEELDQLMKGAAELA